MFPQSFPQADARVRELVAEGRRMFTRSPLSDVELEMLARAALVAELEAKLRFEAKLEAASVIQRPHGRERSSEWVKIQPSLHIRAPETSSGHCDGEAALRAYDEEYERVRRR